MSYLSLLGMALALAVDAFAVSIASGIRLKQPDLGHYLRLPLTFGVFQFLMPIVGWFLGSSLFNLIESWDHWVAFALLIFVAQKMIRDSFRTEEQDQAKPEQDFTRGISLLILGLATSIDALAVGMTLALLKYEIWIPAVIIGITAALLSALGLALGHGLGRAAVIGKRAELFGGLVLIAIGISILIEHRVFG